MELNSETALASFAEFLVDAQKAAQKAEHWLEQETGRKRKRKRKGYTGHSRQTAQHRKQAETKMREQGYLDIRSFFGSAGKAPKTASEPSSSKEITEISSDSENDSESESSTDTESVKIPIAPPSPDVETFMDPVNLAHFLRARSNSDEMLNQSDDVRRKEADLVRLLGGCFAEELLSEDWDAAESSEDTLTIGVNAGSFGNEKSLIMRSKQVQWELLEQRNLNAADAVLLSHLNALAAEPIRSMARGPSLSWGLAQLRARLPAHAPWKLSRPVKIHNRYFNSVATIHSRFIIPKGHCRGWGGLCLQPYGHSLNGCDIVEGWMLYEELQIATPGIVVPLPCQR
ncbi:hypothetical protein B0H10DRAFT_2198215 [Mycena sp. CBHHK59/15]|nr:hypothetical protein B0H10DRAFT_2198215 [Mycena sp. CBHHK59/15]